MTCIVGFVDKKNGNVVMGADSAAGGNTDITIRKDDKIFKVNDFVIGCTSSYRMIQLLRYSFNPPKVHDKEIYEYMCTDFIKAARDCFKDGGYLQKYKDGDEKGGTFLVGYKDRLFKVDGDFQVAESACEYDSCGCGKSYALGSMFSSAMVEPELIVSQALKAAENFSGFVQGPFITIKTEN